MPLHEVEARVSLLDLLLRNSPWLLPKGWEDDLIKAVLCVTEIALAQPAFAALAAVPALVLVGWFVVRLSGLLWRWVVA
jgi:hypothetical protein